MIDFFRLSLETYLLDQEDDQSSEEEIYHNYDLWDYLPIKPVIKEVLDDWLANLIVFSIDIKFVSKLLLAVSFISNLMTETL